MRIGLFTFHRAINYGAVLQCLSLKTYLESQGHEVDVIDYWPTYHAKDYHLWKCKSFVSFLYTLLTLRRKIARQLKFTSFFKKNLNLTSKVKYRDRNQLSELDYDLLVYGSDQIWWYSDNLEKKGFDTVYWGTSVDKSTPKITYAASMGKNPNLSENEKNVLKTLLLNFKMITLREKSLQNLLNSIVHKEYPIVLDPVFLQNKEFWKSFSNKYKIVLPQKKYVLFYDMIENVEIEQKAIEIAKENNYELVYLTKYVRPFRYNKRKFYQTLSPFEFLFLLDHASIVVSSSFHGVAFSLIYNKPFYAISTLERSNRVHSLLNLVDIKMSVENNIIYTNEMISEKTIDKLMPIIDNSKKLLKHAITI